MRHVVLRSADPGNRLWGRFEIEEEAFEGAKADIRDDDRHQDKQRGDDIGFDRGGQAEPGRDFAREVQRDQVIEINPVADLSDAGNGPFAEDPDKQVIFADHQRDQAERHRRMY